MPTPFPQVGVTLNHPTIRPESRRGAGLHHQPARGSAASLDRLPRSRRSGTTASSASRPSTIRSSAARSPPSTPDRVRLGTAVAIVFARNPMVLANVGLRPAVDHRWPVPARAGLAGATARREPVQRRPGREPAARMRELVPAARAIWDAWETGEPLPFDGDFYPHTLMIPAFDPGPNPFGRPPVLRRWLRAPHGRGRRRGRPTGLITHPVQRRRSARWRSSRCRRSRVGNATTGRSGVDVEVVWATLVVTGRADEEHERSRMRPAPARLLRIDAGVRAHARVPRWASCTRSSTGCRREGRWDDMAALIPDTVLETIAVVGLTVRRSRRAARARLDGIADVGQPHQQPCPRPRPLGRRGGGAHVVGVSQASRARAAVRPCHRHLVIRARVLGTDRRHPVEHHARR